MCVQVMGLTRLVPPQSVVSLLFWIQALLNMVKHGDISPKWQLTGGKKQQFPSSVMEGGHKHCNHRGGLQEHKKKL